MADTLPFLQGWQAGQEMQDNALLGKMRQFEYDQKAKQVEQTNALSDLYRSAVGADGKIDRARLVSGAASSGLGSQIPALQKSFADQDKSQADLRKTQLENSQKELEALGAIAGTIKDQPSMDRAIQWAKSRGYDVSQWDPVYNPEYIAMFSQAAVSRKDQIAQELDRLKLGATIRGQDLTAQTAAEGRAVTMRGQDMTNQRQVETGQVARDAKTQEQLDKKVNAFSTQLDKTNIPQFESLLSDIEAEIAKYQKGDIPGYGPVAGNLPQFLLSREGQILRQKIATLQNLTLKDRSGAAVTNQELQRLLGELGTGVLSTDDQLRTGMTNVRRNLDTVKRNVIAGVDDATLNEYQSRGGMQLTRGETKPNPTGGAAGGPAKVSSKAEVDALPSGAMFVTPDGVTRRKP